MTLNYTKHFNTRETPQSQPIPGRDMVKNNAGGFVFAVTDWVRLERFLVLGAETPSYSETQQKLTIDNAQCVLRCIKADGLRTVQTIVDFSDEGRAPKNDPAIFALAMCLKLGDEKTRKAAAESVPQVCRIPTHLFGLMNAVKAFGGFGRVTARAFANWYNKQPADKLALNLVKYQQRDGWSHKDVLSLSHAGAGSPDEAHSALYSYVMRDGDLSARTVERKKGDKVFSAGSYPARSREALPRVIEGFEKVREKDLTAKQVAKLITEYDLPREVVPTEHLNSKEVWDALLHAGKYGMPVHALVRNLGKMTSIGLLAPMSDASKYVVSKLKTAEYIRGARLHPLSILLAHRQYQKGRGDKGSLTWSPVSQVVDALDGAFYLGFKAAQPTGLNFMLALDVSGSMRSSMTANGLLSCAEAAAAMALVTANVEDNYLLTAFTSSGYQYGGGKSLWGSRFPSSISPLDISPNMRIADAMGKASALPMGGTDCALPMMYAMEKKIPVDVFVVLTDNETWAGSIHPMQALRQYRESTGRAAKLIVQAFTPTQFSIADPNDAGCLDIVGFDANTPAIMSSFVQSGLTKKNKSSTEVA